MSNQKSQSSIEKKSKTKKDYSISNKKITDFFSNPRSVTNSNNTDDISVNYGKNENNINNKEEDKSINLIEDEDDDNSNINLNNHFYNNSKIKKLKKKMDEDNIINNNKLNHYDKSFKKSLFSPSFFINLNNHSESDKKRKLIFMVLLNDNKINSYKLDINPDDFDNIDDYHKSFPFQNCRIININNSSYIIGGKLNDDISKLNFNNEIGVKNNYKLIYNIDTENKIKIKIIKLSPTLFEHQSHTLLYLKKYNTIVLCSGHKQKFCEYLNLNDNDINKRWKFLFPLRKSRENAICLLFNEKYIFLIGGKDDNGKLNEDYDVLNYNAFLNSKFQCYWKTYSFKDNNNLLLEQKGSGTIYYNNNIYILGGFNLNNKFLSWKINFEEENGDKSDFNKRNRETKYIISSAIPYSNINNYINEKYNNINYSFCGEQIFMNYKEFFVNISFGGKIVIIPNSLLK